VGLFSWANSATRLNQFRWAARRALEEDLRYVLSEDLLKSRLMEYATSKAISPTDVDIYALLTSDEITLLQHHRGPMRHSRQVKARRGDPPQFPTDWSDFEWADIFQCYERYRHIWPGSGIGMSDLNGRLSVNLSQALPNQYTDPNKNTYTTATPGASTSVEGETQGIAQKERKPAEAEAEDIGQNDSTQNNAFLGALSHGPVDRGQMSRAFKQMDSQPWKSSRTRTSISSTISRDNTCGENARQAELFAEFGRKRGFCALTAQSETGLTLHMQKGSLMEQALDPANAAERAGLSSSQRSDNSAPTPKYYTPRVWEPSPSASRKPAPALSLLPTPRLTPLSTGFNTPEVNAASYIRGRETSHR
jgi:hypothetical protein